MHNRIMITRAIKSSNLTIILHQSDIIQISGARRSLSSENPDSAGDVEESEDDEIEFKEPSPVKNQTSLRRTSRRTSSSSSSFTPIKMVKSPGEVTPKKTRKSPSLKKKEKTNPSKRSRGRPRKKKSSSSPEEESSVKCDDESTKYGELTIEVAEKKEEMEDSEDEVTFIDEIFAESPKLEEKKKKRKQSYDWSENEVFSLIGMKILY